MKVWELIAALADCACGAEVVLDLENQKENFYLRHVTVNDRDQIVLMDREPEDDE